ncbi:MAG: hypothetical protein ACREUL_11190 [Steroidobacteraceae bacterium]
MRIRSETAEDAAAIEAITIDAFAAAAHSEHREHLILDALRKAGQLTVSLVAALDSELVGHIAASPPEYFQAIAFREEFPRGAVSYHVAFAASPQ